MNEPGPTLSSFLKDLQIIKKQKVKIVVSLLPDNEKLSLLHNAGFDQIEMVWEAKYES